MKRYISRNNNILIVDPERKRWKFNYWQDWEGYGGEQALSTLIRAYGLKELNFNHYYEKIR